MLALDHARTAVLSMDLQTDIVARFGDGGTALLERAATVLTAARKVDVPVLHVVVGFRPGYPEVSPRNATFSAVTSTGKFVASPPGSDIATPVRPESSDVVVVKHRVSAFAGSDLEMILRAKGIETLVLFGLATSGVVLSTLRQAADLDYRIVVVSDCCGDGDDEVHRVLLEKVFVRQASVVTASEVVAALAS